MRNIVLVAAVVLAGCSASGGEDGVTDCSPSDRTGTYLLRYAERKGGTCGAIPDVVARLDNAGAAEPECSVTQERWSDGDCKLERTIYCVSEADGLRFEGTAITEQLDSDGAELTGLYMVEIRDLTGGFLCLSTYDVSAVRQ